MDETSIRIKKTTMSILLKVSGLWQYRTAKRMTLDDIIKKLAEDELERLGG